MNYIIAVFRSRSQTLDFISKLKLQKISASAINTPREANVGCGLSAKLNVTSLQTARAIIARQSYSSFSGIYKYSNGCITRLT